MKHCLSQLCLVFVLLAGLPLTAQPDPWEINLYLRDARQLVTVTPDGITSQYDLPQVNGWNTALTLSPDRQSALITIINEIAVGVDTCLIDLTATLPACEPLRAEIEPVFSAADHQISYIGGAFHPVNPRQIVLLEQAVSNAANYDPYPSYPTTSLVMIDLTRMRSSLPSLMLAQKRSLTGQQPGCGLSARAAAACRVARQFLQTTHAFRHGIPTAAQSPC